MVGSPPNRWIYAIDEQNCLGHSENSLFVGPILTQIVDPLSWVQRIKKAKIPHLHSPTFREPPSLTFCPAKNPKTPRRYWRTTATTRFRDAETRLFPSKISVPSIPDALPEMYPPL